MPPVVHKASSVPYHISGYSSGSPEVPTPVCTVSPFEHGWAEEGEEAQEKGQEGHSVIMPKRS